MKKIAIYGLGERFHMFFRESDSFLNLLRKCNYEIVGYLDRNVSKREVCVNGKVFSVSQKEEWKDFSIDYIVVTSDKYYEEIKSELYDYGFKEEQILELQSLLDKIIYDTEYYRNKCGIEIGGPSNIFKRVYEVCKSCDGVNFSEDTVWWRKEKKGYCWKEKELGQVYIADATDLLLIEDNKYDFVLSSNNLEHIANPLKALEEFCRITKNGGIITIAVPIKEKTFDHNRKDTLFEHLLEDYKRDTKEDDLTHLPEILQLHDYDMDLPCGGKEAFAKRAEKNFENRCLHHHVFSEKCLRKMYEYLNLEVIDFLKLGSNYIIRGSK